MTKSETVQGTTHTYGYRYDVRGRLVDVTRDGTLAAHYDYDPNGNRSGKTDGSSIDVATYDNQDRLRTYGAATYTYGANGELETKSVGAQTTTYTYDALGNLTRVVAPGTATIDYIADGEGRRVGKKLNGVLTQAFLYKDQLQIAAELDGVGNVVSTFVYGTKLNVPEYSVKGGEKYRLVTDQLGSVRLVVKTSDGSVAQRLDYDEFGVVTSDTNPGFQPFGFAGGLYDVDTKLVRFRARDYDAVTGRWTVKDPTTFDGGQANLYAYVENDPVNSADVLGIGPIEIVKCLVDGYSMSECLGAEQKLLCKNWGIACAGDSPLPAGRPAFPRRPKKPDMCFKPNNDDDCGEEWADARDRCLSMPPSRRGQLEECMRGYVSERCGGAPTGNPRPDLPTH